MHIIFSWNVKSNTKIKFQYADKFFLYSWTLENSLVQSFSKYYDRICNESKIQLYNRC